MVTVTVTKRPKVRTIVRREFNKLYALGFGLTGLGAGILIGLVL